MMCSYLHGVGILVDCSSLTFIGHLHGLIDLLTHSVLPGGGDFYLFVPDRDPRVSMDHLSDEGVLCFHSPLSGLLQCVRKPVPGSFAEKHLLSPASTDRVEAALQKEIWDGSPVDVDAATHVFGATAAFHQSEVR